MVVEQVAELARIKLTSEEKQEFEKEFQEILKWFAQLDLVDTSGVEPAFQPIKIKNVARNDEPKQPLSQQDALANTKHKEKGLFKGPRIV